MKFFHSLFFKLLFCLLIISIIPLSIVGLITYNNTSKSMTDNLDYHASYILDQKVDALDQLFHDLERISSGIVHNKVFSTFSENDNDRRHQQLFLELDQLLVSIENIFPAFEGITIINESGFIYNYGYPLALNITANTFYQSDWFPSIEGLSYPALTPLHTRNYSNMNNDTPVYSFVYQGWDNKLNSSYIIIDLTEESVSNITNIQYNETDIAGTLIYNDEKIVYSENETFTFSYHTISSSNSGGIIQNEENKEFIIYKQKVPSTGWTIVEYFEVGNFFKPVYDTRNFFLYTIIVSVIVCILASLFVTKQISNPIYNLQKKMKEVESGNFEERFITNSKDVIGDLAKGFNHMLVQIKALIKSVEKEEKLKREAEITALQLQINPHFVYNTLESINSLARKKKEHEISHLIVLLGRLLRLSISSFDEMIPVRQEIMYTNNYLELQQKRMRQSLDYNIDIEDELYDKHMLKWILQPIVENAILHGIDPQQTKGDIEIKGKMDNQCIIFTVTDNGSGISPKKLREIRSRLKDDSSELTKYKKRIGLYNVQSRIHLHYGLSYGISIDSEEAKGTVVTITIPQRSETNE
ncbi:sensor histidine kinase [Bacillus shivajii]|uniref:sensor histidine kinase n=1 Tax=Bacillus shivajii TaxID=1983719 RepID=UPI001CF9B949|nr:sensor histidine kinase [Bacillus shivajii]UCZ52883.1 sensor histidine kinase [Bacillus shivajii]